MFALYARPDLHISRPGHLKAFTVERRVCGAPPFMRGLRALFVSDVHVLPRTTDADLNALVDAVAAAAPDILLLGGDYSDSPEGTERFFGALSRLDVPLGVYGVIGNNDAEAWEGRLDALRRVMARAGCEMLVNSAVRLRRGGGTIHLAGIDEHRHGNPDPSGLYPVRSSPDAYRILLAHYPGAIDPRPDMMLCGHTHGGQFNLLGLTPFAIGFERYRPPRVPVLAVSGMHDIDGMRLLVSKGIGASRIQLRVGVRPEIDLLVFE